MGCMAGCWSRCSGILNWSNFCALVSGGLQCLSQDKKSIQIQFMGTDCDFIFNTGRVLISCVFVTHFDVCICCACVWQDREKGCVSIRQACLRARGFTTQPYTYITHLAEGYASRFKVSSNISLSEMQLKKPQNTPITVRTNRFSMPSDVRPINWENEHDWGPVSTRAGKGQTGW